MHEADEPDLVGDLFNANVLSGKNLTQVDLTPSDADTSLGGDCHGAIVEGVVQVGEARIGVWRGSIPL